MERRRNGNQSGARRRAICRPRPPRPHHAAGRGLMRAQHGVIRLGARVSEERWKETGTFHAISSSFIRVDNLKADYLCPRALCLTTINKIKY